MLKKKSVNKQKNVRYRVTGIVLDFCRIKNWGHPVGDTALQHSNEWRTAAVHDPYFKGNPPGSLSDTHQPQIFCTRAICVYIIAS
jgi:hypothetical protein